jgi:penicillin-binding protein 1A
MANVYATLADGGLRNTPIAITKVVFPDGRVDRNWGQPHRVRALSEAVAAAETNILTQNVQSGTATRSAISCPTAAKTGTTSELVDAWLDGYTPNYSTVVWMGYPNKRVSMTDVHGQPQQGGYLPAEIWHAYMSSVIEGRSCVPFPTATESVTYQPFFGKYATTGQTEASGSSEAGQSNQGVPNGHSHRHGGGSPHKAETGVQNGAQHGEPAETATPAAPTKPPGGPAAAPPGAGHGANGAGGASAG